MSNPATYDPSQVLITLGGHLATGFAEDRMVTIEKDENDYDDIVGVEGEVTRSKNNNEAAIVTLYLMQSSPSNEVLSGFRAADKASPGSGVFPFGVKDGNGTSLHTAESAWVQKGPTSEYGKKPGPREWKIRLAKLRESVGSI